MYLDFQILREVTQHNIATYTVGPWTDGEDEFMFNSGFSDQGKLI